MNKRRYWLWRAVDQDGTGLDILVQSRRDQHAAERFLHRALDAEDGVEPRVIVTNELVSYVPAIKRVLVGLLELAVQVYQLGGAVRFGVQQVFTELFCLALLREPSVERVKHVLRSDLGAVMGCTQAACVKTLRRKLDELSQQRQAVRLSTLLAAIGSRSAC
jgi:DDE domain